jgi:hypothetical protein
MDSTLPILLLALIFLKNDNGDDNEMTWDVDDDDEYDDLFDVKVSHHTNSIT